MSTLSKLNLTAVKKSAQMSPVQYRRNKLAKRLWEQAQLAKSKQTGTQYTIPQFRTVKNLETGERRQVELQKRVKQCWFTTETGKLAISIRYGNKLLELARGKFAVEIADETALVTTLDVIRSAVLNGELDAAIEAASAKLRAGFGK